MTPTQRIAELRAITEGAMEPVIAWYKAAEVEDSLCPTCPADAAHIATFDPSTVRALLDVAALTAEAMAIHDAGYLIRSPKINRREAEIVEEVRAALERLVTK